MNKCASILAIMVVLILTMSDVMALDYTADVSLAVGGQYNDNIYLSRSHKVGDFALAINPGLSLTAREQEGELMVSYSPSFNIYADHDDRSGTSHVAAIRGRYRLSEALTIGLTDAFTQSQDASTLRTIEGGGPITSAAQVITSNSLNADLAYRFSRLFSLQAAAGYNVVNYAGTDSGDQSTYIGRLGLNYILNERITLRLGSSYTFYDYRASGDAFGMEYILGANWRLTPTITLDGYGGVVVTRLDQEGRTDTGYSLGLSLTKRFERGNATLAYAHGVTTGIEIATPLESDVVSFRYTMPVTAQLDTSLNAFYGNYRSMGDTTGVSSGDRDEYGGSVSLTYRLWQDLRQNLAAFLSYSYVRSNARAGAGDSYSNNVILIGLRFAHQLRF